MEPPKRLFKYYKFNSANINAVVNSQVWLSSPIHFNDPFDSKLRISCDKDEEILRSFIRYYERISKLDSENLEVLNYLKNQEKVHNFSYYFYFAIGRKAERIEEVIAHLKEDIHHIPILSTFYSMIYSLGIACFSEEVHSPIMWAHYADNHKGFCIEYELNIPEKPTRLGPVDYTDNLPEIIKETHDTALSSQPVLDQLRKKSKCWSYEKEYRLTDPRKGDSLINIQGNITGIYYGLDTCKSDKDLIESVLRDRKEIKYYSPSLSDENRSIDFAGITKGTPPIVGFNFSSNCSTKPT